ncbi:hypothetical protein K8I61_08545 [bacterium]|nr:hypothetical protein [bacterium]
MPPAGRTSAGRAENSAFTVSLATFPVHRFLGFVIPIFVRRLLKLRRHAKRLVFATVPTAITLVAATAMLNHLESENLIETWRPDDRAVYTGAILESRDNGRRLRTASAPMVHQEFTAVPASGVTRVVMAGASFMMGSPYVHQDGGVNIPNVGGIPNWLDAELTARFPSRRFEVINAAVGSMNSFAVRAVVCEMLRAKPHIVVVATGNNEGYVPATRFNETLHKWTLYRSLKRALKPGVALDRRSYFTPQDPDTERIAAGYRENVKEMVERCGKAGVRLVLCTLPIHLTYRGDLVTTHGLPTQEPLGDKHYRRGIKQAQAGFHELAIESFSKCPSPAWAAYRIGRSLGALGRFKEARELLKVSVELNPSNRQRPSCNAFVREIAIGTDVALADLERAAEKHSPNGIPSATLFMDYCHMTWRGYHLMALEIVDAILARGWVTPGDGEPKDSPDVDRVIATRGWDFLYKLEKPVPTPAPPDIIPDIDR